MGSGPSAAVLKQLRTLFQVGTVGGLTDGQLLEQFVQRRDETAFAVLVERHGPMVLRVCRSRLGDRHDAEDAFQSTFLVLSQKASSIRKSEAVAGWLLGVACRVSAKARSAARRRMLAEQKIEPRPDAINEETRLQSWEELYEELERLPEKYRLPLVLCHMEGLTYEQAAMRLGCPVRTVQSRLIRGRERLRGRLVRRGLAPSAELIAVALLPEKVPLIVPVSLNELTVQVALRFANLKGAAVVASPAAVILAKEVLRTMFLSQINAVVKLAVLLGLLGAGGWLAWPEPDESDPRAAPRGTVGREPAAPAGRDQAVPPKTDDRFQMTGTVRLEGTGEPVAGGHQVQVDLGSKDSRGESREGVTASDGRYTISLPEGNARPSVLSPPPGYWLPEGSKAFDFFAVTPHQPVYRKDYIVRRGSVWKFRLTSGTREQPAPSARLWSFGTPGEYPIIIRSQTNENGFGTVTLPSEAAKVTLSLSPKDGRNTMLLVKLNWDEGFRTDAVKAVKRQEDPGQPARFLLTDQAGRSAMVSGPVEVNATASNLLISAVLPEPEAKQLGTLTGTVLDQDGRPIADANVKIFFTYRQWGTISAQDEHRVRTDTHGRYVLRSIPRQTYEGDPTKVSVVVHKDGYAGIDSQEYVFQPGDDGTQNAETIRLEPGVSLSGTVVGPDGRPVVGAMIRTAGSWSQATRTYKTGPNGRFTIPNLSKRVIPISFTFGALTESGRYVVDGKGEELKVQLHTAPGAKAAAAAAETAPVDAVKVGQPAPPWHVRDWTDGKGRTLADFGGKVVVLDFWGIWCGGCVTSLPVLDRLQSKFEPLGVVFLSIHTPGETMDKIRKLYDLKKVSLISALDEGPDDNVGGGTTARAYRVGGYPTIVLIEKTGKIAFRSDDRANQPAMEALIKKRGIDVTKMTEEKANQLAEALLLAEIEKALTHR